MIILEDSMAMRKHFRIITERNLKAALIGLTTLCLLIMAGCLSRRKTEKTVTMEEPRSNAGIVVEDKDPNTLEKLSQAIDALELDSATATKAPMTVSKIESMGMPQRIGASQALRMANGQALPADATRIMSLPKLSDTEINEISARLELDLGSQGYMPGRATLADALPLPPQGIRGERVLARSDAAGTYVLRFGFQSFVSQPPQFWVLGVIVSDSGALALNPDLASIEPAVTKMLTALDEMRKGLSVRDLETKLVQLSYVDDKIALAMLKGMGVTTMAKPEDMPAQVDFAKLPYVVVVPDPEKGDTGLVGGSTKVAGGQMGLSLTPGTAGDLTDNPVAGPMTQLMVTFHPAHPEQFSDVRHLLDNFIDRPARQIFIEGMVLEISESGLKEMGVDWNHLSGGAPLTASLGTVNPGIATSTLDAKIFDISEADGIFRDDFLLNWSATIKALVREGKAEILSRPSVLTLNNRQATIRVGQDIPIVTSTEGLTNYANKLVFKFEYLSTGILLNIRPRINESGTEVSMLIDTIVSAQVPGEELIIYASNDPTQKLAEAPTISTRRVQTYGRIRNNTPFIIGGLVARDKTSTEDKVPILGDLPWIGIAFRSTKIESLKREVIIVLTPYILPEEKLIPRSLPKDEDLFDSFGHELFRDSYRIRAEDVFDLNFLLENPRIVAYRTCAREVVDKNFRIGGIEPFRTFVRDLVPGEDILVTRMIYEVIKRLDLADPVLASRLIYLRHQQQTGGGYDVQFLEAFLAEQSKTKGTFKDLGDKAVALTFTDNPAALPGGADNVSIPEVSLIDCPDREAWGKLLWELNQPTPDGKQRYTVLIQDESDVLRLRRAQTLKKIITLNGGADQMRLRNFSVGKVLLMPELRKNRTHLIDAEIARFFFHTEHYYAATLQEVEEQLELLDALLRRPDISVLLESEIPGVMDH